MRKIILSLVIVSSLLIYFGCKKSESSGTSPTDAIIITENSFPKNPGTNYKYSYNRFDSLGQTSGNRITFFDGNAIIQGTTYKIQIDSLIIGSIFETDSTYFRTSGAGLYYFVDTTGFAESITDSSLIPLIPYVVFDQELLSYSFPLSAGKNWTAFKVNLTYPLQVTVIDVSASNVSQETITLNLSSGQTSKDALKIKFTLTLRLNPLSSVVQTYTAFAWLIPNVGVAKCEGNGALVNFLTGQGINLADTSTVVNQALVDYQIK